MIRRPRPPRVVIELALEHSPRVRIHCRGEGEEARIRAWIAANPRLTELVEHALQIADERRTA